MGKIYRILQICSLGLGILTTANSLMSPSISASTKGHVAPSDSRNNNAAIQTSSQKPISKKNKKAPSEQRSIASSELERASSQRANDQVIIDRVRQGLKNGIYTK